MGYGEKHHGKEVRGFLMAGTDPAAPLNLS